MPPKRTKKSQNRKAKKERKEKDKDAEKQKELLLSDFRNQVQKQIEYFQIERKRLCADIRSIYHKEIIQLSKKIRSMTMKEYFEQGGDINGMNVNIVKEEISSVVSQNVSSVLSKVKMKQNQENKENSGNSVQCTRMLRPRKVQATTGRKMTTRSTSKMIKDVNCNTETTPCNFKSLLQIPMITPKFDPSLPTPAVLRKPRAGEIIVSMEGSPLYNAPDFKNHPAILMSIGTGKVINITDSTDLNEDDIQSLDDTTKKSLLVVQEKLNKLLPKSG